MWVELRGSLGKLIGVEIDAHEYARVRLSGGRVAQVAVRGVELAGC